MWGFVRYFQPTMRQASFLSKPVRKVRLRSGHTKRGPNLVVGRGLKRRRPRRTSTASLTIIVIVAALLFVLNLVSF